MAWIDDLADALDLDHLSSEEAEALLDTARDVAHRVERKVTPLSTFLMGMAVGRGTQLAAVREQVDAILPAAG